VNKIYIVQEYYYDKDSIKVHPVSIRKTLQEAYNDMIDVFKFDTMHYMAFPSIPEKCRDEFIKNILSGNKDKSILTIL
jgi:hypothetical protein